MIARIFVGALILALIVQLRSASSEESAYGDLLAARWSFDSAAFSDAHERLVKEAQAKPDDYTAQYQAAESFRLWATRLRNERNVMQLDSKADKERRRMQAELGTEGMVYANRAIELADGDAESAQAHRVAGELYSHLISGMISGMRNGPKAKTHINHALDLSPNDPECLRSIAIMYLHNPPISGGDVPRAIETFNKCSELVPESDIYPVLLAMTYRKAKRPSDARASAQHALELNPHNKDALALLRQIELDSQ